MSRYINSMRLFLGSRFWLKPLVSLGIVAGIIIVSAVISEFAPPDNDFLAGFVTGIMAMCSTMMPIVGVVYLMTLYSAVHRETPGFKFFSSVPDARGQFKRAVITSNVLVILQGTVLIVVFYLIDRQPWTLLLSITVLLIITGIMNFSGIFRKQMTRLVLNTCQLVLIGFLEGLISSVEQDEKELFTSMITEHTWMAPLMLSVSAAVYAAGLAISLVGCGRKWGDD